MKTTILKTKYFLLVLLIAISFSCSKEDGADGLPGPAGAKGTDGVNGIDGTAGPAGTNGTNGEDGNANVFSSEWYEPVEADFSVSHSDSKALPIPLTNYDSSNDALLIYYYNQNENNPAYSYVYMLPYFQHHANGEDLYKSVTVNIRPSSSQLYIIINSYGRDLLPREFLWEPDATNLANKGVRFRYMIIKGNSTTSKNGLNAFEHVKSKLFSEGVNINDYQAVCDYYGIKY